MKKIIIAGLDQQDTASETEPMSSRIYRVQIGMYQDRESAERDAKLLKEQGYKAFVL